MLVVRKMVFVSLISRLIEYLRLRTISIKIILLNLATEFPYAKA